MARALILALVLAAQPSPQGRPPATATIDVDAARQSAIVFRRGYAQAFDRMARGIRSGELPTIGQALPVIREVRTGMLADFASVNDKLIRACADSQGKWVDPESAARLCEAIRDGFDPPDAPPPVPPVPPTPQPQPTPTPQPQPQPTPAPSVADRLRAVAEELRSVADDLETHGRALYGGGGR